MPNDASFAIERPLRGERMWGFIEKVFPICRSITGDGLRQTLAAIADDLPIRLHEVPTGERVLDWTVPKEWNIRQAWIRGPGGEEVVDFANHNLHVVSYSVPVRAEMSLSKLRPHLYSLPEQPDLIPYRTSYYRERWGFCLPHRILEDLPEGTYEVLIDSTLEDGALSYGEILIRGQLEDEVLLSCHACHPSLANDNLSGLAVCKSLAEELLERSDLRYSYRFLFLPGTIGAITWLARNQDRLRIRHGLVAANLGDSGAFHYKRSRRSDAAIDRTVEHVLAETGVEHAIEEFVPFGYDERQYCSPGFDLPVGCLTRTPWGRYPEYHTSADNLDFVSTAALLESLDLYRRVVNRLEEGLDLDKRVPSVLVKTPHNRPEGRFYLNLAPKGEPQLGRRGLYGSLGGDSGRDPEMALLWVLNMSDGSHDLATIAKRSSIELDQIEKAAGKLVDAELLKPLSGRQLGALP